MLSTDANAAKICPKLPKTAKICLETISSRNFEISPKIEILVFFFSMSKNGEFQQNDAFFKVPYVSIRTFSFFSTLNLMILQTKWNECVRFLVDI